MNQVYLEGYIKDRLDNDGNFIFVTYDKKGNEIELVCDISNYSNDTFYIISHYNYVKLYGNIKRSSLLENKIYIDKAEEFSEEKYKLNLEEQKELYNKRNKK